MNKKIMDGNKACATVSYKFTEVAAIYPITPASTMAEHMDTLSKDNNKNFFNDKVKVIEMQSEAGAIGAVHGMLQNGILSSTYTASQGLLLMIPNMYKIAGECLPCVINVAARTIATHALSILGDHSDIYATRQTGFALLASSSVQQIMDLTNVAYLSTIKGSIPFVNFFDGFRTSHEYNTIEEIDFDQVKKLIDQDKINEFRKRSLDIDNPTTRGTNQTDQIYFQSVEARNKYYNNLPNIVEDYMNKINEIRKTNYAPFNYYGSKKAKYVIVAMGSVCETIKETIDYLKQDIGLIEVHLYRPFSTKHLLKVLPKTTKKIAVLDRTKEPGANGEPLYLDICEAIKTNNLKIEVVGGRYGLSSKDTNCNHIEAVYNFLKNKQLHPFTIGIEDDVTNLSLKPTSTNIPTSTNNILIYGYGSDGMITASKDILTIVGNNTNQYVQGYFEYDSKKSGGVTISHLRFSNNKIRSAYYIKKANLIVCTKETYLNKYEIIERLEENGIFLLNTEKTKEELNLPKEVLNKLIEKNIKFYIIDASKIARDNNIPNKISMIMENAIFELTTFIDKKISQKEIINMIKKNFSKKGEEIVVSNISAVKDAIKNLTLVDLKTLTSDHEREKIENTVFSYLDHGKGNDLKVSDLEKYNTGIYEKGMSELEKRSISTICPSYDKTKCIQCNLCSFVCPHAVIRPYLLNEEEKNNAPDIVKETLKEANIKGEKLYFTIGVSSRDCTGCKLCTEICPTKAIAMKEEIELEEKRYEYLKNVTEKIVLDKNTVKGSQFIRPSFEFSGACAGCGETPYLKLLSQLFKDNLMIANATGCSSIYGSSVPNTPYKVPWINSLFEDNAEFGYGIRISEDFMHEKIKRIMEENKDHLNQKNKELIDKYLNNYSKETSYEVYNMLDYDDFKEIQPLKKYLKQKSIWLVGGDGWAYDIGFGGIDHVISNNENVNILVLDTECYSNTGGQASKSTREGAIAKFASEGKKTKKKNLAKIAMSYPNCYVGTISLGANYKHTIDTLIEAEKYNGPSIIIAYAPCIAHGIKTSMSSSIKEEKLATESGYFPLFKYNPENKEFKLVSKANFDIYDEFLSNENRYKSNKELLNNNKNTQKEVYETLKEENDKE